MTIIIIGVVAFLLYVCELTLFQKLWDKGLQVHIHFEDTALQEGEMGYLTETIENHKLLPLPMLKVKFQCSRDLIFSDSSETAVTDFYYRNEIFTVMSYQKLTRRLQFKGNRRGYYHISNMDMVGSDLFLSQEMVRQQKFETVCLVYPRPLSRAHALPVVRQVQGELSSRRQLLEDPFEYRGIREYQPFDEMKAVNWKATARTGELKVNEHGYTTRQSVRIFMNLKDDGVLKHEEAVENAIRLCVTLSMDLLEAGNRVAVYANCPDCISGEVMQVEPSTGSAHLRAILSSLARLETRKGVFDFVSTFGGRLQEDDTSFLTIMISTPGAPEFQETVAAYVDSGKECRWIYVTDIKQLPEIPGKLQKCTTQLYVEGV